LAAGFAMSTGVGHALPLIPHAPAELVGFATAENSAHRMALRCSNTSDGAAPEHHHVLAFSVRATRAYEAAFRPALTSLLTHHPGRITPIEPSPPLGGLEASRSSHRPRKSITDECRAVSDRLAAQLCSTRPRAGLRHQSQRSDGKQHGREGAVACAICSYACNEHAYSPNDSTWQFQRSSANLVLQSFSRLFVFQITSTSPRSRGKSHVQDFRFQNMSRSI
jgi:hypothetical protein